MSEPTMGPTEFAAEVERLKAEGKFPSLETLLAAIAETHSGRFWPMARTSTRCSLAGVNRIARVIFLVSVANAAASGRPKGSISFSTPVVNSGLCARRKVSCARSPTSRCS